MIAKTNGLILLFLLLFSKYDCSDQIRLKFAHKLPDDYIRTVVPASLSQCHRECLARQRCNSFNYLTKVHLCQLMERDTDKFTLEHDKGYVYSEKKRWEKKTLSALCTTQCNNTHVCQLNPDSSASCVLSECVAPATVDQAHILGNMRHVGAKILYECDSQSEPDPSVPVQEVASVCRHDGTWSPISIKCRYKDRYVYKGCFIDTEDRIFPGSANTTYDPSMTTEMCYLFCKPKNTEYFGTQYAQHCFCGGATYEKHGGILPESRCNYKCDGNQQEMCGGDYTMSVYEIQR